MIEKEEGDCDQVESENCEQVETNVDVSPGEVIQDIAVVMVLLTTNLVLNKNGKI